MIAEASSAHLSNVDAFATLARRKLRAEPPRPGEPRADLRGDHAFDIRPGETMSNGAPRVAAVLVPIVAHSDGPTVLMTERAAGLRQHSGQIAFPGGKVDDDDPSPLAAALREAEEEIGLPPEAARPLGYLDAYLSGTNYLIVPAVALIAPHPRLVLNRTEVASAFEVPLAFLMDEANHELHAREWRDRVRAYYAIPFGPRYIWGVTAGILRNMYERLSRP